MVFLEPLGAQRRYAPHFKGLISVKVELEAQGHDSTFIFSHALLKKAILQYKIEFGRRLLNRTVSYILGFILRHVVGVMKMISTPE